MLGYLWEQTNFSEVCVPECYGIKDGQGIWSQIRQMCQVNRLLFIYGELGEIDCVCVFLDIPKISSSLKNMIQRKVPGKIENLVFIYISQVMIVHFCEGAQKTPGASPAYWGSGNVIVCDKHLLGHCSFCSCECCHIITLEFTDSALYSP